MEIFTVTLALLLMHGCPLARTAVRVRRDVAPLSLTVEFLSHTPDVECYGGSSGLGNTTLRLDLRSTATNTEWVEVESGIPTEAGLYSTTVRADCECVQFRLVQEEHGGGPCNCWRIKRIMVDTHKAELARNGKYRLTKLLMMPFEAC